MQLILLYSQYDELSKTIGVFEIQFLMLLNILLSLFCKISLSCFKKTNSLCKQVASLPLIKSLISLLIVLVSYPSMTQLNDLVSHHKLSGIIAYYKQVCDLVSTHFSIIFPFIQYKLQRAPSLQNVLEVFKHHTWQPFMSLHPLLNTGVF